MTVLIGSGESGFVWISANLSHIKPALNPMKARSFSFLVRGLSLLMPNLSRMVSIPSLTKSD